MHYAAYISVSLCPDSRFPVLRTGGFTARFFRNYPFSLLLIYLTLASSNLLPQRPYIVLFIILSLLLVPSTNPLLYSYATAFSTASISRLNPSAKLFKGFIDVYKRQVPDGLALAGIPDVGGHRKFLPRLHRSRADRVPLHICLLYTSRCV